jgi:hypothetical protein
MTSRARGNVVIPGWIDSYDVKPLVDDDGNISVLVASITPDLETRTMLYDGSSWVNAKLIWGYSDRYIEQITVNSGAGGTTVATTTLVPEGEVWQITGFAAMQEDSTARIADVSHCNGGTLVIHAWASISTNLWYSENLWPVLKEDDYLRLRVYSMNADKRIKFTVYGYKMDIT